MTKNNYAAWHIDAQEFSESYSDIEKLKFFAKYAVLAPSGHNTQPWHFSIEDQVLLIHANYNRRLPYSGLKANEPLVSIGCCLETLCLAAEGFGYKLAVNYQMQKDLIAKVKIAGRTPARSSLLDAIVHRVSNRHSYDTKPLPETTLNEIIQSPWRDVVTQIISSRDDITFLADKTKLATHRLMGDKYFRAELSKWVRNNLTNQYDGMPGFVQGVPTPPSLVAKHIIKRMNVSKDQANKDSGRVLNSANLVIIVAEDDKPATLLDAGRLYARICVLAQEKGIASAGVGAAVIDIETGVEVMGKFGLSGKPIAIIRLGKTLEKAKHTPRWPFRIDT